LLTYPFFRLQTKVRGKRARYLRVLQVGGAREVQKRLRAGSPLPRFDHRYPDKQFQ